MRKKPLQSISATYNISTTNQGFYKPKVAQREYYVMSRSGSIQILHIVLFCYDDMRVSVAKVDGLTWSSDEF